MLKALCSVQNVSTAQNMKFSALYCTWQRDINFKYNRSQMCGTVSQMCGTVSQMCGTVLIFRPLRLSLAVIAQHNVTLRHYVAPVQYLACCTMAQA